MGRCKFAYGLSWGHLVAILGHLGAILGRSWGHLGPAWGYFTSTLLPADLSQDFFETCVSSARNACFWNPPTLAVSRATVGASLGPSWAILGHIEPILGPSWAFLGLSWPSLRKICQGKFCVTQNLPGQILRMGHLGAILGPSWGHLGAML